MEFTRTTGGPLAAAGQPTAADTPERTLSFGTVTHASEGAKNAANVAELLLFRGLATVSKHRSCALLTAGSPSYIVYAAGTPLSSLQWASCLWLRLS